MCCLVLHLPPGKYIYRCLMKDKLIKEVEGLTCRVTIGSTTLCNPTSPPYTLD